jgi:endonuclease/exonuclease/phosphatase family metal-dependent hydrolase
VPDLSLVSFNTHYGLRPLRDDCGPYDLLGALAGLGEPDVFVIQEVWRPDGKRGVVDEFAETHRYERHDLEFSPATITKRWPQVAVDGEGSVGLAILSRIPARPIAALRVGPTIGDHIPLRRALHVELDVDGTAVDLIGVHLTSRLPHGPPMQLRRLSHALPPPDRPAIVTGDCNFWGPGVERLLPGFRRAVIGRTWPAPRPHSQIDHVMVRGAIDVEEAEVLGPVGSDHRPVRVRLRIR